MIKKVIFAPHFNDLNLRNAIVPLMMSLASCDTDAGWHPVMPVAMAIVSPDQNDVSLQFDCLDLRNVMVSLTILMASYNANISAKCMI